MQEPYWLKQDELSFPDPEHALAEPNGLLAVGGDLSRDRLLLAYQSGIFPWYETGQPILWWSPDPRMVLVPDELHVSRSLKKLIRKKIFTVSFNQAFQSVIEGCANQRDKNRDGTWITEDMHQAYLDLHKAGWAHSVEVWENNELVGGLYGIAMGKIFFGESMFSKKDNASKIAFVYLVQVLKDKGFKLIDCQVSSLHLVTLGAKEMKRKNFMQNLRQDLSLNSKTIFSV